MNLDWSLIGKRDNNCSSSETASNNLCFSCKGLKSVKNSDEIVDVGTYCYKDCFASSRSGCDSGIRNASCAEAKNKIPVFPRKVFYPPKIRIPEK
jgi:hypothetical protein